MTEQNTAILDSMEILNVGNREHIIRSYDRCSQSYDNPNYLGSRKALVGVLHRNESLESFKVRYAGLKKWY